MRVLARSVPVHHHFHPPGAQAHCGVPRSRQREQPRLWRRVDPLHVPHSVAQARHACCVLCGFAALVHHLAVSWDAGPQRERALLQHTHHDGSRAPVEEAEGGEEVWDGAEEVPGCGHADMQSGQGGGEVREGEEGSGVARVERGEGTL
jgi:hypothetical protein